MYNLAIRKCTSSPLLAPRLKIFKIKFTTPPGFNPGPAESEADMLPSEPTRRATMYYVYMYVNLGFKGASTSQGIGARNEMMMDDDAGQMIFGDLVGLKLPDICRIGEEKPRKNLTQETCPHRGSNPGPLRDKRACYSSMYYSV